MVKTNTSEADNYVSTLCLTVLEDTDEQTSEVGNRKIHL